MIRYTKEYIKELLDRFMDGETTVEEEDVLSMYFRQADVPEEWRDYQAMFAEWQSQKPVQGKTSRRWLWLIAAAAVLLLFLYVAVPQQHDERPAVAQTATEPEDTTTTVPAETPDTVAAPAERPKPRQHRKRQPRLNDVARDYVLRAQAEQQRVEQEIAEAQAEVERVQLEVIDAQLRAKGYVSRKHEDGTIEYINENEETKYYAYEPD